MARIRLMAVMVLMCCLQAAGQSPSPQNGATWYQQAIEQYQAFAELSQQSWELILSYDPAQPPTPEVRAALAGVQPILDTARRGSLREYADFQLDYSQGVEMMLPHLGALRGVARLMNADAMVRLHDGDAGHASERLADLYRMSGHFGDDRIIISSMVGDAVFNLADRSVQTALDRGAFTAEQSASLVSALERLGTNDPFAYVESVMGEQEMMVGWLREQSVSPEGLANLASIMGDGNLFEDSPLLLMSQEQFEHEIEVYDATMSRVVEIFNNPDRAAAKEQMKLLDEEIEGMMEGVRMGGEGALVAMLLPALSKVLDRMAMSEQSVADRLAMLSTLAAGKARPEEFANAAIWYLRGIEMLEKLRAEVLESIRAYAADTSKPITPELAMLLASPEVQAVIAVFAEGSGKRRCDFSLARERGRVYFIPSYAPGMHDAFRILHADAVRRLNDPTGDQPWEAADRFATCLRMVGHMGSDPIIVSALIAHHDFDKTIALLSTALKTDVLPPEAKPALFDALERASRRDPFGYVGAIVATRTAMADTLSRLYSPLDPSVDPEEFAARRAVLAETIKALDGDHLLYLMAVVNTMERNAAAARAQHPPPLQPGEEPPDDPNPAFDAAVRRMADVISYADLEAAQQDTTIIGPALAQGALDVLADRAIPAIAASRLAGNLADHTRRARNDLRRAAMLLRPEIEDVKDAE